MKSKGLAVVLVVIIVGFGWYMGKAQPSKGLCKALEWQLEIICVWIERTHWYPGVRTI